MPGKVFEELVTGRHESGSDSFMCREAPKHYLGSFRAGRVSDGSFRTSLRTANSQATVAHASGSEGEAIARFGVEMKRPR